MSEHPTTASPEPAYPHPQPYTPNFLRRIHRGLSSWFGLLNEWDFRVPVGSLRFLGLHLLLVNDPAAVRRVLVTEVDQFPKHPYTLWMLEPLRNSTRRRVGRRASRPSLVATMSRM